MKPHWWPKNPYPESVFSMQMAECIKVVPNPDNLTALSGCMGRHFWDVASDDIFEALTEQINQLLHHEEAE